MRKLLILFSLAGMLGAQGPVNPQAAAHDDSAGSTPTFVGGVKEVMVPVTVTDRDGNIVSGLTALDFRVLDNSKLQRFTEDIAVHPISLVVLVEASSEVEKILPQIRNVGSVFDSLVIGENGEMAVLAFDHQVKVMTPFTSDPDQIHNAFRNIKVGSWTSALNDATMKGLNMLRNRPANRRRVMIIISDQRDKGSEMHVRDVLTEAEFADVAIYSVDISHVLSLLTATPLPNRPNPIPPGGINLPNGQVMTPTLETEMDQNGNWTPLFKEMFDLAKRIFVPYPLDVYTKWTGGRQYRFVSRRELESAVADIGNELHTQYLLTYSPNDQTEGGYHEITVQVDKPGLKIRTRPGYWLAAKPQ